MRLCQPWWVKVIAVGGSAGACGPRRRCWRRRLHQAVKRVPACVHGRNHRREIAAVASRGEAIANQSGGGGVARRGVIAIHRELGSSANGSGGPRRRSRTSSVGPQHQGWGTHSAKPKTGDGTLVRSLHLQESANEHDSHARGSASATPIWDARSASMVSRGGVARRGVALLLAATAASEPYTDGWWSSAPKKFRYCWRPVSTTVGQRLDEVVEHPLDET